MNMLQRLHVAHNSKVFIIWPFTEKDCQLLMYNRNYNANTKIQGRYNRIRKNIQLIFLKEKRKRKNKKWDKMKTNGKIVVLNLIIPIVALKVML